LATLEAISESERAYLKEMYRLKIQGYENPEAEYEHRKFQEALRIEQQAKRTSRL
jgi:hypothetical protein